jgi:hypothetical protein
MSYHDWLTTINGILGIATGTVICGLLLYALIIGIWKFIILRHSLCTNCKREITQSVAKQFDSQCESCWYQMCQERTLNEGIEQ